MSRYQSTSDLPPIINVETVTRDESWNLTSDELSDLRRARELLSSPGVAIRLANIIGTPIEKGLKLLPAGAAKVVHGATHAALRTALQVAVYSMPGPIARQPDNRWHKMLAGASGAVGGAFGLPALTVELPFSSTLMLRSIAQIAGSQGHDLRDLHTRLSCLEVFALGGDTTADNAAETSYWAVRTALARIVSDAAGSLVGRALMLDSAPAAVRLVGAVASRFGTMVSEHLAAKAVPVVGAAAGAAINVVFMDHFQKMAEGHFIVRRLEKTHGSEVIRRVYESFAHTNPL